MTKLTSLIVAAALIAPSVASAQRHTTPGSAERHATAQAKADADKQAERNTQKSARNETENKDHRVSAAKAGKVNLAAPSSGSPN